MADLVLDSSVTLAWFLPDERRAGADVLLDRVTSAGAIAPTLWPIEVGNAFLAAQRRGRVSQAERTQALGFLASLPIDIDPATGKEAWTASLSLAEQHGLTLYDAVYLELAIRQNLPLASLDRQLQRAATAVGIAVLSG
jgi:predicted nucleic acid-binding protein